MENNFEARKQKSYRLMRMTYDLTMAFLLLGMAAVMLFAAQMKIEQIASVDSYFRYPFGAICLLYGGFRLYRGLKQDYR